MESSSENLAGYELSNIECQVSNDMVSNKNIKLTRKARCEQWIADQNLLPPAVGLYIDTPPDESKESCKNLMRQFRSKRITNQSFQMVCEWDSCSFFTKDYLEFGKHVKIHISDVNLKPYNNGEYLYACKWKECGFETQNEQEIKRHISFHSYHTKLKAVGVNVHTRYDLDECKKDSSQRNQLPELLTDFECHWVECSMKLSYVQEFLDHVQCHVLAIEPLPNGSFPCGWLGCRQICPTLNKMKPHCRTHAGEKVVACYNCGSMFATNAVYEDHCVRQIQAAEDLSCETCGKSFSSVRILRNHARRHINSYKCSFCDLTLSAPSALTKHIRYKHLNYRPFNCQYCSYSCVEKRDLQTHLFIHEGIPVKKNLKLKKMDPKVYACHHCKKYFKCGNNLTKHLKTFHGYDLESGSSRLRYEQSEDGFYRLMPIRYESLEISDQMIVERDHTSFYPNKNLEDAEEFQILQCFEGDETKPASFVAVPSSVDDPDVLKDLLMAPDLLVSNRNNVNIKSNKNPRSRSQRTQTNKSTKYKKKRTDNNQKVLPVNVQENSNFEIAESHESNTYNTDDKKPKSIVISIAHIDEKGKVIKKEIIKSQEMVI